MQSVTEIQTITILLFFFLNKICSYFRDIQSLQQGLLCQSYNFILFSIYPHIFNGLFSLEVILDFFCTLRSEQSVQVYRSLFYFFNFTVCRHKIGIGIEKQDNLSKWHKLDYHCNIIFSYGCYISKKEKLLKKYSEVETRMFVCYFQCGL